jgi:sulfur relay (sulfurtransferase) DsrC/TusE family protein
MISSCEVSGCGWKFID